LSNTRTLKTTNIQLVTEMVTELENKIYIPTLLIDLYINYVPNA